MCQTKAQGGQRCYKDSCTTYMNSIKQGNVSKTKDIGRGLILTPNSIENFKEQGSFLVQENKNVIVSKRQTVSSLENLNDNLDSLEGNKKQKPVLDISENYERDLYVAINPNADPEDLLLASQNSNPDIRSIVASNPATPDSILADLAKDSDANVQAAVASNSNTHMDILEDLAKSDSEYVRSQVAYNENTYFHNINDLMHDESEYVRIKVAENPNTEEACNLSYMVDDESDAVREAIVNNREVSYETLSLIADDDANPTIKARAQKVLDHSEQAYSTDNANLLTRLSTDPRKVVAAEVASNPNAPTTALENVSKNPSAYVRLKVAEHPNASAITLDELSKDPVQTVRNAIAENSNTPAYTLVAMSSVEPLADSTARAIVANPNTPKSVLNHLAQSKSLYIRTNVASAVKDPEVIAHLMNDENPNVRLAAYYNPAMPSPELHEAPKEWVASLLNVNPESLATFRETSYQNQKGE